MSQLHQLLLWLHQLGQRFAQLAPHDPEGWSAVASWVAALATFSAVVVALYVAHRDWRRAERERLDNEAGQARLITITQGPLSGCPEVYVTNHSSQPVFELRLVDADVLPRLDGLSYTAEERAVSRDDDVVPTNHHCRFGVEVIDPTGKHVDLEGWSMSAVITFLDVAGRRWRRAGNEQPIRLYYRRGRWRLPRYRHIKRY